MSKTGQNIYLDLLKFNNILGLEFRNIYLLYLYYILAVWMAFTSKSSMKRLATMGLMGDGCSIDLLIKAALELEISCL